MTCEILKPAHAKHSMAIIEFMPMLNRWEKKLIRKIWDEYCEVYDQSSSKKEGFTHKQTDLPIRIIDRKLERKIRSEAIRLILKILEFADPK